MCADCDTQHGCMACTVGVATGPESHSSCCPARNVPMPEQDGQWGPEWTAYDNEVAAVKLPPGTRVSWSAGGEQLSGTVHVSRKHDALVRRDDGKWAQVDPARVRRVAS